MESSWNKTTKKTSTIDNTIAFLKRNKIPYFLSPIGIAIGHGLRDNLMNPYSLRRLAFRDKVVLERIERNPDCNEDDYIVSNAFWAHEEPSNWELDITIGESSGAS